MSTEEQRAAGTTYETVRDDDGNIVSSTATTTDADGNVVSVVERAFDGSGHVVSAGYTDHSLDPDTGETTTEFTSYRHGVMVEERSRTTSADGTVVEETVTRFDDGDPIRTTVAEDGTVTTESIPLGIFTATESSTIASTGAGRAASIRGQGVDSGEVVWSHTVPVADGPAQIVSGLADGSVVISTTMTPPLEIGETLTWTEQIFPDGARVVSQPIDGSLQQSLGLEIPDIGPNASPGQVTLSYAADGSLRQADWASSDIVGRIAVTTDGSVAKSVETYARGELVDTRTDVGSIPGDPFAPASGVVNLDGTRIETVVHDDGDVRMEQLITGRDGSVRTIRHHRDGSLALVQPDGAIDRFHGDGTWDTAPGRGRGPA